MISSLLHLVCPRAQVYYTLTNSSGGGLGPFAPPPQYANVNQCTVFLQEADMYIVCSNCSY